MTNATDKDLEDFRRAVEVVRRYYYRGDYRRREIQIANLLTYCTDVVYAGASGSREYYLATAATSAAAMAADLNAGPTPLDNVLENVVDTYEDTISGGYGRSILGGSDRERAINLIGSLTGLLSAHYYEVEDGTEQSRERAEDETTYVLMLLLNWLALVMTDKEGR